MILCVNPNAAVDKTLVVEHFRLNTIHRPMFELSLPGGKGCNVARVVKTLGQQAVVTGWVGGHTGQFIEDGLQAEGILTDFVYMSVESRECISILDSETGTMTEVYEKGRTVSGEALDDFRKIFHAWLPKVEMVTLSGSLPPGVPADFFVDLIHAAREAGVRAILDSSGEPLRAGLEEGQPWMIKCNRAELSAALGQPLENLVEMKRAALDLSKRLDIKVVMTLGASGAVAADQDQVWLAQAPRVEAISAVGSGDAFLGGLACGLVSGKSLEESLRLAVAAGAANAMQLGAGRLRPADVEMLLEQVRIAAEN